MSLLAPAVFTLVDAGIEVASITETQDDEPQQNGQNLLEEEKKVLTYDLTLSAYLLTSLNSKVNTHYEHSAYNFVLDVVLPPPEQQL